MYKYKFNVAITITQQDLGLETKEECLEHIQDILESFISQDAFSISVEEMPSHPTPPFYRAGVEL